ncbi:MAG TPA: hypothetical protein VMV19_08280 [Xanthobacteraceae bacterium]|nr:hypothetical protein [Xanthobacteraceae bacterium]
MASLASLVRSPIAAIVQWWQRQLDSAELRSCGQEVIESMAHDVGLSELELKQLTSKGPYAADLLLPRMAALDLNPKEVSRLEPTVMHDMQRVCSMCESHGRCLRDLERDADDPAWKQYCPNAGTLKALDKQPWGARWEV